MNRERSELGWWDATSLVIGGVIGTAIFLIPSQVLRANPSPAFAMAAFLLGGLISWFGALAYAELTARLPDAGGEYGFVRKAWGPLAGFLTGWTQLVLVQTGGIAAIASGFGELSGGIAPLGPWGRKGVAVGLVAVFTYLNWRGLRPGARTGNLLTLSKVTGLAAMVAAVLFYGKAEPLNWEWPSATFEPWQLGIALVPVLWSFEGWNILSFVQNKVVQPQRTIPLALALGLGAIVLVYCISLWVFLQALGPAGVAASERVGAEAALKVLGPMGGMLVLATMLISGAGCANACILSVPWLAVTMSRAGALPAQIGRVSPERGTPGTALLLQGLWSSALILTGSYETLFSYVTFGAWIIYIAAAAGLFRLPRPEGLAFRMPGYPVTPIVFLLAAAAFLGSVLWRDPTRSAVGLGLVALGIPVYWLFRRRIPQH